MPTGTGDTVLEDLFDGGFNFSWGGGGWLGFPIPSISENSTGGNPDGYVEFGFSGAPFRWFLRNGVQTFWPLSASTSLDTIDFSIDAEVNEAGVGVIGGMVAPVVTTNNGGLIKDFVGPFVPVRADATISGWQTITSIGLTANDFCRLDNNTGDRDCNDPFDKPDFSCPDSPGWYCMQGGFYIKSDEISPDPIRLGVDNWRMTFRVTP